jgi:hypothetical protein
MKIKNYLQESSLTSKEVIRKIGEKNIESDDSYDNQVDLTFKSNFTYIKPSVLRYIQKNYNIVYLSFSENRIELEKK